MSQYEDVILEDKGNDENNILDSGIRHRIPWSDRVLLSSEVPGLHEVKELLDDDDASCLAEEEDGVGCPLPSTPEDDHLLDCEVRNHVFDARLIGSRELIFHVVDDRSVEGWCIERRN